MILRLKLNRNVPRRPRTVVALHSHNSAYRRFAVQQNLSSKSSLPQLRTSCHRDKRDCRDSNYYPPDRNSYLLYFGFTFYGNRIICSRLPFIPCHDHHRPSPAYRQRQPPGIESRFASCLLSTIVAFNFVVLEVPPNYKFAVLLVSHPCDIFTRIRITTEYKWLRIPLDLTCESRVRL